MSPHTQQSMLQHAANAGSAEVQEGAATGECGMLTSFHRGQVLLKG